MEEDSSSEEGCWDVASRLLCSRWRLWQEARQLIPFLRQYRVGLEYRRDIPNPFSF